MVFGVGTTVGVPPAPDGDGEPSPELCVEVDEPELQAMKSAPPAAMAESANRRRIALGTRRCPDSSAIKPNLLSIPLM
jgi:hypothetical protein